MDDSEDGWTSDDTGELARRVFLHGVLMEAYDLGYSAMMTSCPYSERSLNAAAWNYGRAQAALALARSNQ